MAIRRLNHAVLRVSDVQRSTRFWREALEMVPVAEVAGAAFLRLPDSGNHHDLGLFQSRGGPPPPGGLGLYHLAWEVERFEDLDEVRQRLVELGALDGESDHGATLSLYAHDPDGIELEVTWQLPRDAWPPDDEVVTRHLDWPAARRRWTTSPRTGS
jgi:catechol-2,3-dioxygenase